MTNDLLLQTMTDKRQTRPLVNVGAPQRQDRHCQTVINIWGSTPRLIDWLTVSRNVTLTLTSLVEGQRLVQSAYKRSECSNSFGSVRFSSRKLEDSRIRQENVVQGSSTVEVLTLSVL
jgi:hypothetical protein